MFEDLNRVARSTKKIVDLEQLLEDPEFKKQLDLGRLLIPSVHLKRLRAAFGTKGLAFFKFYRKLWEVRQGLHKEEDLVGELRGWMRKLTQLTSPVDSKPLSPNVINTIAETRMDLFRFIDAVKVDHERPIMWAKLNTILVPLLKLVAADKGIYFKLVRFPGTDPIERWMKLHKMSAPKEKLLKLKDDDPESYHLMLEKGKTLAQIDNRIKRKILGKGHEMKQFRLMGRVPLIGVDPATGEETVYDRDGDQLSVPDYIAKRRRWFESQKKLRRDPKRVRINISNLRKVDDETIDDSRSEVRHVSLTDDKAKRTKLTRYFPVKGIRVPVMDDEGVVSETTMQVVSGGRYKGCFLDDMINDQGRLIEGTAYNYNPRKGGGHPVPERIDPSEREPYCTVAEVVKHRTVAGKRVPIKTKKMMLKVDGSNKSAAMRRALKRLCCAGTSKQSPAKNCLPSMEWHGQDKGNGISVYFDPKDFGLVLDQIDGMSLSEAANGEIKAYYKELAQAEEATKNTEAYKVSKLNTVHEDEEFTFIESFSRNGREQEFELLGKQREALAWLDANGGSGVCALETGVGKTLTAIGGMVKAVRDGWLDDDASYTRPDGKEIKTNGRFLYVCPPSLKGNMHKEIEAFLKGGGKSLGKRVDVLPYSKFSGASRSGVIPPTLVKQHKDYWGPLKESEKKDRAKGKKARTEKKKYWDPAQYIQIYFDEAHELKNPDSPRSQEALKLWHPRKVCLTASPMEKNPMEAYVLAAVCNNTPLFGRDVEARDNRKNMRRFKERFTHVIGGRIVGVKQDGNTRRDMKTWVKRNVFFADKTQVDEYDLPDPTVESRAVEMAPEVEAAYRAIALQMASTLEAAKVQFGERRKQDTRKDRLPQQLFGLRLRPYINLLNTLSNRPADAMKDLAEIAAGRIPEKYEYAKRYQKNWGRYPRGIKSLGSALDARLDGPEAIKSLAESMGNPKLDSTEQLISSKMQEIEGSRALIFTDDIKLATDTVIRMSSKIGGVHALCLKKEIQLWSGGSPLSSWTAPIERGDLELLYAHRADEKASETGGKSIFALPFREKSYRKYPNLEPKTGLKRAEGLNANYKSEQWQTFVLKEIIKGNPEIATVTLIGKEYSHGHNLQTFNTVVHLDRDHWNSEAMKQRTARAYRQGQTERVQEVTMDATYSQSGVDEDAAQDITLDKIRELFQKMDSDVFDDIIKASQDLDLTAENKSVLKRDATNWRLDEAVVELQLSPYARRSRPPGVTYGDES